MHRHGYLTIWVPDPVYAPVSGQHRGDAVFCAPRQLPDLLQAGVAQPRAVIEATIAFLEYGASDAAVDPPRRVVVDFGFGARWPNEDLQREGAVLVAPGDVPIVRSFDPLDEGQYLGLQEPGVAYQAGQ
jgi:hypothetical protein